MTKRQSIFLVYRSTAVLSDDSDRNKKRSSMLEQAERGERLSSGFPQCRQWTPPPKKSFPSLRTLVARMSHDLRTPLAAILANAEILAHASLSKEEQVELYEEIRLSVDRMNELVSDLLDCSREGEALRPSLGNIVETMERVIRMIGVRPAFRRITITHHQQGSAVGWYNSRLLERALSNIILNACEAVSPETGEVVINTWGGPACLQIEIRDNGPGIPPEMHNAVFQPFFTHGKTEGTGLGLAIAKRIIEDHGGELLLDPGEKPGTSFKISMPFAIPNTVLLEEHNLFNVDPLTDEATLPLEQSE
jgi:signal transduction histidine kinase